MPIPPIPPQQFAMRNDLDSAIERLFMREQVPPYSEDLMSVTRARLRRARSAMRRWKLIGAVAATIVVVGTSPWAAYGAANLVTLVDRLMDGVVPLLLLPYSAIVAMALGASFAAACPVIYLWRSGRW